MPALNMELIVSKGNTGLVLIVLEPGGADTASG